MYVCGHKLNKIFYLTEELNEHVQAAHEHKLHVMHELIN